MRNWLGNKYSQLYIKMLIPCLLQVKPSLPSPFTGRMDGVSISRFVHELDNYFRICQAKDDIKRG